MEFFRETLFPLSFFFPLLKLAESLNSSYGYRFQLGIEGTDMLLPVDTYLYTEWTEDGDELPGWYKARVEEYYADGPCKIVYREEDEHNYGE